MFADTLTITIDGTPLNVTRINQDGYSSEYFTRYAFGDLRLNIRHSSYLDKTRSGVKVDRHTVQAVYTLVPVSPSTISTVRKAYAVIENDVNDGVTDPLKFDLGFVGFLTSANIAKMLNWES
jgi:hypothetical protein